MFLQVLLAGALGAIEATKKNGFQITCWYVLVGGQHKIALVLGIHQIRRHDDHQFGLCIEIVTRPEQGPENGDVLGTGDAVDVLTSLFLQQAGEGK